MAPPSPFSRLQCGNWYSTDCGFCGRTVDRNKVDTYRALRAIPNKESLEDQVPILEEGYICVGDFRSSYICLIGTLPGIYLIHRLCLGIVRHVAPSSSAPLLALTSIIAPCGAFQDADAQPFSKLDGDIFATRFNRRGYATGQDEYNTILRCLSRLLDPSDLSARPFVSLPPEVFLLILSYCRVDHALAMTAHFPDFFDEVLRTTITRQRLTVAIEASRLLENCQTTQETYTEEIIDICKEMTAEFIRLGGQYYLQAIHKRSQPRINTEHCFDFDVDENPQILALQVNHLGIQNIAFSVDPDGKLKWIREHRTAGKIFLDHINFNSLRVVSDPVKYRMIDVAARNRSFHPRALLPSCLGRWIPYSVATVREPYLQVEGYMEPSYFDLSVRTSVYLSYTYFGGLSGLYDEPGEGREEVQFGNVKKARAVRMFGLRRLTPPGGDVAFLQIQTDCEAYLPPLSNLDEFEIIEQRDHAGVRGIWWHATNHHFSFNIVY